MREALVQLENIFSRTLETDCMFHLQSGALHFEHMSTGAAGRVFFSNRGLRLEFELSVVVEGPTCVEYPQPELRERCQVQCMDCFEAHWKDAGYALADDETWVTGETLGPNPDPIFFYQISAAKSVPTSEEAVKELYKASPLPTLCLLDVGE